MNRVIILISRILATVHPDFVQFAVLRCILRGGAHD